MAKGDSYKGRGAMLVEDEPELARPATSPRSRVEKEFIPDNFSERFPSRRSGEIGNDVRIRRRAPVRQGFLPLWMKTRWGRIVAVTGLLIALGTIAAAALAVRSFFLEDPRFRIDTSDFIQTTGNSQLTRDELLSVFGSDIGRNVFYVPLAERRRELERIPWVEHATVMRILPNQLRVTVRERTPVAFVRIGDGIKLVDGAGVILDMSPAMMAGRHFSFPVVSGINPGDALSTRGPRMALYQKFVGALDSSGEHLSANLSEVNLSDPEDVRVTVPAKSSDLLLHFGDTNFLSRYRIYQSHLKDWEQQYPQLASVDLRYDSEVVLKMASGTAPAGKKLSEMPSPPPPTASQTAPYAKAAAPAPRVVKAAAVKRDHSRKTHVRKKKRR